MNDNSSKNRNRQSPLGLDLHSMMQAMPDMIFIMHRNGQILDIYGPKPEKLLAPVDELIGTSLQKRFTKEETKRHLDFYQHCIENKETGVLQYNLILHGKRRYFESRITPLDDNRLLTVVQDITENRQMQQALKTELEYREFLFDTDREGLVIVNNDHRIVDVNKKFCEMLGYSHEEMLGFYTWDFDAAMNREQFLEGFDISVDVDKRFESIHRRKDGSTYHVEVSARSFIWKGERRVICSCRDISDRKKLEQDTLEAKKLAEANQKRFEEIATHTGEFIWEVDVNGYYTYANLAVKTILGYDPEELIGKKSYLDLVSEEDRKWLSLEVNNIMSKKAPFVNLENTMVAKDGQLIHVITNGIPMIGPKGELLGYRGSDRDMTQQREAEDKLRTENANTTFLTKLAIKLTNTPSGTSIGQLVIPEIKKHTGAVYAWYAHFDHEEHAFFLKHVEVESKMLNAILAVAGKDILKKPSKVSKENYRKIAESKVDIYESLRDLTFGTASEFASKAVGNITSVTRIYAVAHVVGGKIYGGTVLGFKPNQAEPSPEMLHSYAYLVAITLRRNFAEQELIKAKEAAEESNRLKSAFLASISHELRTPLNHVIGFSNLIKREVTNPIIHKYASIINNSGINFLSMIEDILALTLSEQTDIKIRMQSFKGIGLFLENKDLLHEILNSTGKEAQIKLHFKPEPVVLTTVYTSDKLKINQVLTNLFRNAVKFTHKGSITFGIRQESKDSLTFYVADTGIGIAKDKLDIIFDFFRQADDSDTRAYGGLGIGLAISKRIANVMGGSLHVESTPGEGTVFYFSVPVSQPAKVTDYQTTSNKPKVLDLQNHTILIAEDDEDSMMMVAKMLKATKARLLRAENGEEAVNLFEQNQDISLVLMDIKMPVMDGSQATRIIKSRKPSLPVIALTAYTLPEEKTAILSAGCDCIVTKPVDQFELFKEMHRFIDHA